VLSPISLRVSSIRLEDNSILIDEPIAFEAIKDEMFIKSFLS